MQKPTLLQIQLARFTPSGSPRYTVIRKLAAGRTQRWRGCSQAEVAELQQFFLEDMQEIGTEAAAVIDDICITELLREKGVEYVMKDVGADPRTITPAQFLARLGVAEPVGSMGVCA